ncbi:loricrin-like isoform X2 [Stylophora pistillata]|uniref:loricrin-like isoform X2 n=1 Tax=Stylophora pistillata TaxID=50429 RepID=UPI000C05729D|nr:loricrin-like isoform X2 [Stylophora pistillata]
MLFVIYSFVLTVLASLIPEGQGNCRNLKFTSFPKPGYRLENHTVRTIKVLDEDLCMAQCYLEPNCVSYNFHKIRQLSGTHNCDLNNATIEHDEDLVKNESYIYRGAENACARNPCKNNAKCQAGFTDRDYQCLCVLGSGFEGHDCDEDLDECTVGTHECEENAECNNTLGSYKCTCKVGFQGNGTNCTDLDECSDGTHNCDVNAECNNTLGSYKCSCKDGFHGNGTNCTDLDECADLGNACDENAECNNILGSYKCTCRDGFHGNGTNCTDMDECADAKHACGENAKCMNDLGSYHCSCKEGFRGNGTNCTGFTAVFTNLDRRGRRGPNSISSHYTGQDHDGQVALSSGIQQWTVPHTGEYRIEATGASGGYGEDSIIKNGGRGARMIGNFHLIKDEIISVLVGQKGKTGNINNQTAGGGGGTFVVRGSNTSLIIAGGGGGIKAMSEQHPGCDASISTTGNSGNNLPLESGGENGHGGHTNGGDSGGGGGGFYANGQDSTCGKQYCGEKGKGGSGYLQEGEGGQYGSGFGGGGGFRSGNRGPGGGGGYSGGSGGANENISCGGGGGSFNGGTNQCNECCYNSVGHGRVHITFLQ